MWGEKYGGDPFKNDTGSQHKGSEIVLMYGGKVSVEKKRVPAVETKKSKLGKNTSGWRGGKPNSESLRKNQL